MTETPSVTPTPVPTEAVKPIETQDAIPSTPEAVLGATQTSAPGDSKAAPDPLAIKTSSAES